MSHEIPGRPWKTVGSNIFAFNYKHYLCNVDFHNKFLVTKQVEGFYPTEFIKKTARLLFQNMDCPIR